MASCEVISMSIDEVQQLSSLCSSDDNWASSATPLQVHGSPAIIPESSPPVRKGAQHSLKISEGGSQQSRSTVPAGISSDDLSTRAQQGSPKGAKRTTSTSHFSHPKLFVGRLSSVPSAASELLCSMGRTGPIGGSKTGRRRRGINSAKRKKGTDWRPDIRSLPNFEDDPIEE
ncbi:uncharacterized protein BROUX77_002421 [Berkeleyomyces rouxiae]|uniref:uncharacterized protein n=1 Tax=Berkeleyomyces rouxiae TaxID=2035830 RepID=UPI003B7657BD